VEVQQSQGGDTPAHRLIAINLGPGYNLPYGRIYNLSELSGIHAIAWIKITCSRGRIMDLDLKIPCHMDGSMSGYFFMMDDM